MLKVVVVAAEEVRRDSPYVCLFFLMVRKEV